MKGLPEVIVVICALIVAALLAVAGFVLTSGG